MGLGSALHIVAHNFLVLDNTYAFDPTSVYITCYWPQAATHPTAAEPYLVLNHLYPYHKAFASHIPNDVEFLPQLSQLEYHVGTNFLTVFL